MKKNLTLISLFVIGLIGFIMGASAAYAITTTIDVNEKKIFFNRIDLPVGESEDVFLPSITGKHGHVYIYTVTGGGAANIYVEPGSSTLIGPDTTYEQGTPNLSPQRASIILIGDEANDTWWKIGNHSQ